MISIIDKSNIHLFQNEMMQAHKLRHQVFVQEKGWQELDSIDGLEIDEFDNQNAVHMLYIENDLVLGYQRLLPSTKPHLLSSVLSHLCEGELPSGVNIWEWTRYCVAPNRREHGRVLSPIANQLLSAIVEWGLDKGIDTIIIEMNSLWLLRLMQLHFRVTPLGFPEKIAKEEIVAVTAKFNHQTLAKLQEMRGNNFSVLKPEYLEAKGSMQNA